SVAFSTRQRDNEKGFSLLPLAAQCILKNQIPCEYKTMFSHRRLSFICLNVVAVLVVAGIGMYLEGQRTNQGTSAAPSSPVPEAVAKPPPTIDEDHRQYLWQIEHHGNVLSRGDDGFRAFGDA